MEPIIDDKKYIEVINNALDTAKEMLQANNSIFEKVLPASLAEDTELRGRGVTLMFDVIKEKLANGDRLLPPEVTTVNRALVEYVQKVELAQSHFMYMNDDMQNLNHFKAAVRDVHHVQMQFSNNAFLEAQQSNQLDEVKSRLNIRPRP